MMTEMFIAVSVIHCGHVCAIIGSAQLKMYLEINGKFIRPHFFFYLLGAETEVSPAGRQI